MNASMLVKMISAAGPAAVAAAAASLGPVVNVAGHELSENNAFLLSVQRAGADVSTVGGFRQWLRAGRAVRKGEKGAYILRPAARRRSETEPAEAEPAETEAAEAVPAVDGARRRRFVAVCVFDVSQTDPIKPAEKRPKVSAQLEFDF